MKQTKSSYIWSWFDSKEKVAVMVYLLDGGKYMLLSSILIPDTNDI
jgi:hypothetical protein